ncbi:MAG: transcription-repair coupling factor, partial [Alphaproteobacteria bacterium]
DVFALVGAAQVSFDYQVEAAATERLDQIGDHFSNREAAHGEASFGAPPYKALAADQLYLSASEWSAIAGGPLLRFTPFEPLEGGRQMVDLDGREGREFGAERASDAASVIDAAVAHINAERDSGRQVLVVAASTGARDRLMVLLGDHGLAASSAVATFADLRAMAPGVASFAAYPLERGFTTPRLTVLSEQDILGERLTRRRPRRGDEFLTEVTALSPGDLVVHVDHGIARFAGLKSIDAAGAPHDCLELHYHGSDKLYLPVENIEMLSRFGSDEASVQLDRLGGAGWQARKARAKERIAEIADGLIKIAAARALRTATRMVPDDGLFDEFRARFAFDETEDQASAIDAVLDDLASGRPMDRLVCGDVGFGKTEVAIRAAFVAAASGFQTAIIGPTTLLARQHYNTFVERFAGFPMQIGRMSRLVGSAEMTATRAGLASGEIDIVIGTHALLGKSIEFKNLGLVVVDEEQHFGVVHKERLKELRHDVHVLTLTATPIPRTLQFALSGVRDLSLIASPPVDRLAVRTFITPFDPVVVREALLRELYRGGQSFFVCPRIRDLDEIARFLREQVPEVKFVTAHGRMAPGQLDDVMNAFYEGKFDVLLSTTIIESGLDIPSANTLVVYRADRFGLAQLYQLRGRVGRSKTRAYALFTVPANRVLSATAERRLKVLQSLDYLGAGFSLASHDLDIRGAGNLLGQEQSGHIREVGFELYQSMLEEAVAQLRDGGAGGEDVGTGQWSPIINIGASVLIPERYVEDLQLRLSLYRRLAGLETRQELEGFAAELIDRFGPLPEEVENLMQVVGIKAYCRTAGIAKFDAGPKGAVFAFRDDKFANPAGLLQWIQEMGSLARVRPDHRVVVQRNWVDIEARLKGSQMLAREIARIAEG